jgi:hypothetical protein
MKNGNVIISCETTGTFLIEKVGFVRGVGQAVLAFVFQHVDFFFVSTKNYTTGMTSSDIISHSLVTVWTDFFDNWSLSFLDFRRISYVKKINTKI